MREGKFVKKFIASIFTISALSTMNSHAMSEKETSSHQLSSTQELEGDLSEGRDFSSLSLNADDSELMFVEGYMEQDKNDPKKEVYNYGIFRLNLAKNTLRHYKLPESDKYRYTEASFSPKGNYVLMKRQPVYEYSNNLDEKENEDLLRQSYEQAEIVLMNADGSNFKVIKASAGIKGRPVMNNSETKIAYVRGVLRPKRSKTFASNFDIWEIDLKDKTDKLFAGPYEFYDMGRVQYLEGDEGVLANTSGPKNIDSRKYNYNSIQVINRSENGALKPMVLDKIKSSEDSSIRSGNLFFRGEDPDKGMSFFKKDREDKITKWVEPISYKEKCLTPTSNGGKIFFIYSMRKNEARSNKRGIGFLNTTTSKWQKLDIPKMLSSKPISVANFSIIEVKQTDLPIKKIPNFSLKNPTKN